MSNGSRFQLAKAEYFPGASEHDVWYDLQLQHNRATVVTKKASIINLLGTSSNAINLAAASTAPSKTAPGDSSTQTYRK